MNKLITNIKETKDKITRRIAGVAMNAKAKLEDTRGSVSEHAIVIIIGVVLGGLLLTGLIALMSGVIMPSTESKVESMFAMG